VNDKDFLMESVMVVSKAIGTIIWRRKHRCCDMPCRSPAVSVVKIETKQKSVLAL
jgi:hypothetical protein